MKIAKMVSKANEDLPEPERPVKTINLSRGIFRSIFFKLFWLAPLITISSCSIIFDTFVDILLIAVIESLTSLFLLLIEDKTYVCRDM